MKRIKIADNFYIKAIAGREVAGNTATVSYNVTPTIIAAEVDGLAPFGHHDGKLVFTASDYEAIA